ncbi:uncharacterized protein LOC122500250 isoform X2 [Leptopilina heterotoma]|uniref:uncharacterized protein LOC122500250 isoform X2 n=1 Tax=Leptopilina heterotoma TaxID=63436 RepID=UPI001CA935AC|nr:uncharacterized protein LOC122500250 isoform X2 [Leptopilina heterotoma]
MNRMMASLNIFTTILLAIYCIEYVKGEAFIIPISEATPDLGVTVTDMYAKCEAVSKCSIARIQEILDVTEQISGERMIHRIVEIVRQNYSSINENEWNTIIDEECRSNVFLHELPNTGIMNLRPCMPHLTSGASNIAIRNYIQEYCNRVSRVSKQMLLMFEF